MKNTLNKWYPRGQNEDTVTQQKVFFRLHFQKELYGQGTVRSIAFYTDFKKLEKDILKLIKQDTYISNVYKFELPNGTSYAQAMLQAKYSVSIFNEDLQKLIKG